VICQRASHLDTFTTEAAASKKEKARLLVQTNLGPNILHSALLTRRHSLLHLHKNFLFVLIPLAHPDETCTQKHQHLLLRSVD